MRVLLPIQHIQQSKSREAQEENRVNEIKTTTTTYFQYGSPVKMSAILYIDWPATFFALHKANVTEAICFVVFLLALFRLNC